MPKTRNTPETENIPDTITQQRELSMLTLQKLYEAYKTLNIRVDFNDDRCVAVYYLSPEQISVEKIPLLKKDIQSQEVRLFDIYHENYSNKDTYWIRIQNGDRRLTSFNDEKFFGSDDKYDYLSAFFYKLQHPTESKKAAKSPQSIISRAALTELENKQFPHNTSEYTAWDTEYKKPLNYLQQILIDPRSHKR